MKYLVLNGPNLNFLGIREPNIYGNNTYDDLVKLIKDYANSLNIDVECYQSNHEGALIDKLQQAYFDKVDGIIFNPGAYTHTSVALHDCLKSINIPCVEVHISDVSKREAFRQISYIKDCSIASVIGKGFKGYLDAIDILNKK